MSDIVEQIKVDREAGTPGAWSVDRIVNGNTYVGTMKAERKSLERVVASFETHAGVKDAAAQRNLADARRIARVPEMEALIIEQAAEIERLRAALKGADKANGELARNMVALQSDCDDLRDERRKRQEWLRKAKQDRGYSVWESFDNVWLETCKSADLRPPPAICLARCECRFSKKCTDQDKPLEF
jgi:hypothetical protein